AFSEEPDDDATSLTARIVEQAADRFYEAFGMPSLHQLGRLDAFTGRVNAIAFSGDGLVLATAREDGEVHLWGPAAVDSEGGFRQGYVLSNRLRGHSLGVTSLSFSWDNLFIYAGGRDGTVRSWSVADGSEVHVFEGHSTEVRGVALLSDERVVSGSLDGEVRVFDPYWQASRRTISESGGGGALFVAEDPGGIEAIAVTSAGAVVREYPDPGLPVDLRSPLTEQDWVAGTLHGEEVALAGVDRVIRLFDLRTGKVSREFEGHDGEILALSSDQGGDYLLSGARDRLSILWSGLDGDMPESWEMEHDRAVTAVSLSADGTACATADSGNTLSLWDVADQRKSMEWEVAGLGKLHGLAVSSDGTLVATGLKLSARVYKASGKADDLAADFGPPDAEGRGLVFRPDGRRLVTGDASGKIYIWDVGGEERLIELEGHAAEITSLCFADEGRTLLSADVSGEVLAWRSNFDASRYKRWRKTDRVPLRAKRIIDFFGGDLGEAAARLRAGYPGLDASDSAVTFILDEAMKAASVSDVESPLEDF
ncbi:MAG: WD40 repeat domain-containing protein, partial [Planctomycetota bacterium]|nr:WD40 repeat domain-containing protein [Planctomycetota bacterium]